MQLLSPGVGLALWQLLLLVWLVSTPISCIVILRHKQIDDNKKIIWMLACLFLPLIGAIYFFISLPSLKKENTSSES